VTPATVTEEEIGMSKVLDDLHRDHANIGKLLDLLDMQLRRFEEAALPDFDLMLDILDYTRNYPDISHHPKEDLVYKRLLERAPEASDAVEDLVEDHAVLLKSTVDMTDTLTGVVLDAEVSREHVAGQLRDYITAYRRHIDREEADIFPRAEKALTAADWDEIDAAFDISDPLFGTLQEKYRTLHHNITMM
jgi:hemerythrin-like domain-containing protein